MSRLSDFFRGVDGAASSGAPVNTIATLNIPKDVNLYVDPNGGEWLRNGHFITSSFASYPNAVTSSGPSTFHVISQIDFDPADDTAYSKTDVRDYYITDDGSKFFVGVVGDISNDYLLRYDLSTAFDLNSKTFIGSGSIGTDELDNGFRFNDSGTVLIGSFTTGTAYRWTLSSAFDLSTLSARSQITNFAPAAGYGGAQEVSGDGNYIYYRNTTTNTIQNWGLTTSFGGTADASFHSTKNLANSFDGFLLDETIDTVHITKAIPNSDGTELLVILSTETIPKSGLNGTPYNIFLTYEMTTPHDLSTCILKDEVIIHSYRVNSDLIFFTSDLKYAIGEGDVKKTSTNNSLNILRLDDAIGIPESSNKNLFLKVK